jgi:hypothetical protein
MSSDIDMADVHHNPFGVTPSSSNPSNRFEEYSLESGTLPGAIPGPVRPIPPVPGPPSANSLTLDDLARLITGRDSSIEKPPKYDGRRDRDRCRTWLLRVKIWIQGKESLSGRSFTVEQKIFLVGGLFEKAALDWWTLAYEGIQNSSRPNWDTYEQFTKEFQEFFGDIRTQETRRDEFDSLTQTGSVASFYHRIKADAIYLDPQPTEADCLLRFKRGLKADVRKRLDILPDNLIPKPFDEYAMYADKCERELHANSHRKQFRTSEISSHPKGALRDADGDVIMTLNAISKMKLSKEEYTDLRARNACFLCKKEGHQRKDCPLASKNGSKQTTKRSFQGKGRRR